jgi:hypothetical protein
MDIEFEKLKTVFGRDVYYADLEYTEIEDILKKYECEKLSNSKGYDSYYTILPFGYYMHANDNYYAGAIFKSKSDHDFYYMHFDKINEHRKPKNKSKGYFIDQNSEIRSFTKKKGGPLNEPLIEKGIPYIREVNTFVVYDSSTRMRLKFSSKDDFLAYVETQQDVSVFFSVNPYGDRVLKERSRIYYEKFVVYLRLKELDINFTKESLEKIDLAIYNIAYDDEVFYKLFLALTLYVGDCIIENSNGRYFWVLESSKRNINTVIPNLGIRAEKNYASLIMDIYESFKSEFFIAPTLTLIYSRYIDPPVLSSEIKD